MTGFEVISPARWTSLATGSADFPSAAEWPMIALAILAFVVVIGSIVRLVGLSWYETAALALLAPALLLVNIPLGVAGSGVTILANVTGCILPVGIALSVVITRRAPLFAAAICLIAGVAFAFFASRVVPSRGVLLEYQGCALGIGLVAAILFRSSPQQAGALAFASAAIGTTVGADVFHLSELIALPNTATITLGGAGLLDGILLTAIVSSVVAASGALGIRSVARWTWRAFERENTELGAERELADVGVR